MMMNGGHQENATSFTVFSFRILEITSLDNDRHRFDNKYAPGDYQNQRLMNEHGNDSENSAQRQRTSVAHKYFCGVAVVPQEAEPCSQDGSTKYGQLADTENKRNMQISRYF